MIYITKKNHRLNSRKCLVYNYICVFWGDLLWISSPVMELKKKKTFLVPIFFKLHYISRNGGMRVCILFDDFHYNSTRVMGLDQIKHYVVNVLHDYLGLL